MIALSLSHHDYTSQFLNLQLNMANLPNYSARLYKMFFTLKFLLNN